MYFTQRLIKSRKSWRNRIGQISYDLVLINQIRISKAFLLVSAPVSPDISMVLPQGVGMVPLQTKVLWSASGDGHKSSIGFMICFREAESNLSVSAVFSNYFSLMFNMKRCCVQELHVLNSLRAFYNDLDDRLKFYNTMCPSVNLLGYSI